MAFFEDNNTPKKVTNSLWVEKYRPSKLTEYVGNEHLKDKVKDYLESGEIPHLLFFGKAGTGKTTLAKLIVNSIDCDHIIINASDENNVDTVRNKVKGFCSTVGFKDMKIIILDEFDYMTPNAQAILRNLMETFSRHCRFILTCNYVEKVISPIRSRTQEFQIVPPSKKEVAIQVSQILGKENVEFELKDIVPIIDSAYPDIRKIINTCQLNSSKGQLKLDTTSVIDSDLKSKVVEILKGNDVKPNKWKNIRQAVADSRTQDFTELYTFLYEKVDEYGGSNTSNIILILSESQSKDALVVDKEITFMSCIIQIVGIL
jgi:DNA polymerase III delta prime subunit